MDKVPSFIWFLLVLILELSAELVISIRNRRWILLQGGKEFGAAHSRLLTLFHAAWVLCFAAEVWLREFPAPPIPLAGVWWIFLGCQLFRYWCICSLGRFWNINIFILPTAPRVRRGPYRWIKHPNYFLVLIELFLYPWLWGAAWTAVVFTLLHLPVIGRRLKQENAALAELQNTY